MANAYWLLPVICIFNHVMSCRYATDGLGFIVEAQETRTMTAWCLDLYDVLSDPVDNGVPFHNDHSSLQPEIVFGFAGKGTEALPSDRSELYLGGVLLYHHLGPLGAIERWWDGPGCLFAFRA